MDCFSDSALPDSEIPHPQLGILSPTWDLISPIGDHMPNWGYFLLVVYCVVQEGEMSYIAAGGCQDLTETEWLTLRMERGGRPKTGKGRARPAKAEGPSLARSNSLHPHLTTLHRTSLQ